MNQSSNSQKNKGYKQSNKQVMSATEGNGQKDTQANVGKS